MLSASYGRLKQHVEVVVKNQFYDTADRRPLPVSVEVNISTSSHQLDGPYAPAQSSVPSAIEPSEGGGVCTVIEDNDGSSDSNSESEGSDDDRPSPCWSGNSPPVSFTPQRASPDGWKTGIPVVGPAHNNSIDHDHKPISLARAPARTSAPQSRGSSARAPSRSTDPLPTDARRIRKPHGEPGKPSNGGYSLKEALGWPSDRYNAVRRSMNQLVDSFLDTSRPLTKQTSARLEVFEEELFPEFGNDFQDRWPIRAFASSRLHYLQNNTARLKQKAELAQLKESSGGVKPEGSGS
ncbi:uncharacterized protein SCHCODRAFT_02720031 [Schizophyllum commune H4-8]|uniref:Uncharacterized protein n=1 Tax=Schizophyllum commune (strain H4-8 / FGSC 9210) TaxID=578458 RepID=D8QM61_SCHCM|nr:uncharacterized protein SCHCODRAFT_02720031 [Schizophyllum commune H4-8]KAI5836643.1 hypothetical protein SCHCODRAFT_02720031 [Schizophyllum commune H4-8]